jgi:hypothetical protein
VFHIMRKSTALLVLIVFCLSLSDAMAQRRRRVSPTSKYSMASAYYAQKKYYTIGASINAVNYFGDIAPSSSFLSTDIRFTRPNFSIFIMRRMRPRVSWKASFMWSRLEGDDFNANTSDNDAKFRFVRNLQFRNDIKELNFTAVIDLFENKQTFLKRPNIIPYVTIGIGVMAHNPIAKTPVDLPSSIGSAGEWVSLQPLGTEGQGRPGYKKSYSLIQVVIPAGVGVRYKINSRTDIGFEWSFRYTFTDYLDDVSGNYATEIDLGGKQTLAYKMSYRTLEPIAAYANKSREAGMREFYKEDNPHISPFDKSPSGFGTGGDQRGNPTEKDWYMIYGFHINYIIPPSGRKARFR